MRRHAFTAFIALASSTAVLAHGDDVPVDPVLAVVGGSTVPLSAVDDMAADQLRQVRDQEFTVRRQALEEVFFQLLTEREAKARGVSPEDLVLNQVDAQAPAPTEAEKRDFYGQNKARLGGRSYEETSGTIGEHLRQLKVSQRRAAFLRGLKAKYGVKLFLEPPRSPVDASNDPAQGPQGAPVTLVVFSDFQCPHCSKAVDIENRLKDLYGNSLRVVFRDYPLAIHKEAPRAAEAGACAADQGKFWPFHDLLFTRQGDLSDKGLTAVAVEAGLNAKRFSDCLSSGKNAEEWKADAADGQRYGVSGTPTFFINGRMIFGTPPFEVFVQAVDDELLLRGKPLPGAEKIDSKRTGKGGKK